MHTNLLCRHLEKCLSSITDTKESRDSHSSFMHNLSMNVNFNSYISAIST